MEILRINKIICVCVVLFSKIYIYIYFFIVFNIYISISGIPGECRTKRVDKKGVVLHFECRTKRVAYE